MKNYIVTGGLGHIGSHVVDELILRGDNVLIIDNLLTGSLENKNEKAEFLNCSVADILNEKTVLEKKWDGVFHLAAYSNVLFGNQDPIKAEANGANLTLAMLELCRKLSIPKMVFISSVVVEFNPFVPYGIEKEGGEKYCLFYEKHFDLDVSIIRLHNVYGSPRHGIYTGNVIPSFLDKKKKNEKIKITGDGSQMRDFVYYTDIVNAILEAENKKGITEIGTCEGISILEVAKFFDCPIEFIGRPKNEVDSQVCKKSDYKITIPFKEGIQKTLNFK
ncbi:MAG: NAD-dependent epimerase/dehydratase family protein [Candidatus Pacebacteria bacterium]|nr:NAD-dependent epimerase/dehydratase family protein [Candidatus Paceibacterota bacterium]